MIPNPFPEQTCKQLFSIPSERSSEVIKVLDDYQVEHYFIGYDQSHREIHQIRYKKEQIKNVMTMLEGLEVLERTSFASKLLGELFKDLFFPRINKNRNRS